jgi:hypothetical protein
MLDIQHGEVFELTGGRSIGLRIATTNLFWKDEDGSIQSDAALLLMRRSFGKGRMNITLQRKDAFLVREAGHLEFMAKNAAEHLFGGNATAFDTHKIASIIEDHIDSLINHPPEEEAKMIKRQQRQMQMDGLVIIENGKTVVDAR